MLVCDSGQKPVYQHEELTGAIIPYKISMPADCAFIMQDLIGDQKQEFFCTITLNGNGEAISTRVVTIGLLNHTLVHPREVFRDAIIDCAASVILCHNHPSGSLEPSTQDIAIITQLRDAGALIGIQVLDHIIVTKEYHVSMKEKGYL